MDATGRGWSPAAGRRRARGWSRGWSRVGPGPRWTARLPGAAEVAGLTGAAEVAGQLPFALDDLARVHVLLAGVREVGVAGAVVHRGDPGGGEPGHVGPPELGRGRRADRRDEVLGGRYREPGQRAGGAIGDRQLVPGEHLA